MALRFLRKRSNKTKRMGADLIEHDVLDDVGVVDFNRHANGAIANANAVHVHGVVLLLNIKEAAASAKRRIANAALRRHQVVPRERQS